MAGHAGDGVVQDNDGGVGLVVFLLYFAPQFSVYTKFGIDPNFDFARLVLLIRLDFTFGKGLISNMFACTKQKYIFSIDCTTAFLSAIALMPVALL